MKSTTESCSTVSDSLWPHELYSPWNSPSQNTGVGSLSLLQGIFPTQGSNPGLPHCRQILYQLNHKGGSTTGIIGVNSIIRQDHNILTIFSFILWWPDLTGHLSLNFGIPFKKNFERKHKIILNWKSWMNLSKKWSIIMWNIDLTFPRSEF